MNTMRLALVMGMMGCAGWAIAEGRGLPPEVKDCLSKEGVSINEDQNPADLDQATRQKVHACFAQGRHGGPGGHHPDMAKMKACLAKSNITLPDFQPGVRPEFDDVTRAAMDKCRQAERNTASTGSDEDGSAISGSSASAQ